MDDKIIQLFKEFLESPLGKELRAKKDKLGSRIRVYKTKVERQEEVTGRSLASLLYECGAIDIKLKKNAKIEKPKE